MYSSSAWSRCKQVMHVTAHPTIANYFYSFNRVVNNLCMSKHIEAIFFMPS